MILSPAEPMTWTASAAPAASDDLEEKQWVARARRGDEAAYAWLLSRYRERAVRLAAHVLRRPSEAEDVAQEAFIRAFQNLRQFRGEGRFYTWLYHIVVRACLDRKRAARWSAEVGADDMDLVLASPPAGADTRLLVEQLLDSLSPPMRAALVLRELDGLDYDEIAGVLEIPVGTVRSRLNAARSRFRTLYEQVMQETQNV
jgi:RNA polymerase sigma-70 factor (ECF subfamily)